MHTHSRFALFLMEQMVVIIIFAICAAVCVAILADSYLMTERSTDMSHALRIAESAAECYKAASGDTEQASLLLNGEAGNAVHYDKSWQVCGSDNAAYVLTFTGLGSETPVSPLMCEISVTESDGAEIIALTVAARRKKG